jgi:hypothetical protein
MGRIKTNFVAAALMLMRKLANICNIYARKKFKKVVIFILLHKCNCSRKYEGYHRPDCRFLAKFKTDLDLPIPQEYDPNANWELLCCCKES